MGDETTRDRNIFRQTVGRPEEEWQSFDLDHLLSPFPCFEMNFRGMAAAVFEDPQKLVPKMAAGSVHLEKLAVSETK